jgi:putative ABC transport system permease protein
VLAASRPASDVATYVNVDGVAAIEPQLSVPVSLEVESRRYATTLIGLIPETTMRSLAGSDGRTIPLDPGGVILGTALRDTLAVGVGDTVSVALETGVSTGVGIGGNGARVTDLRVIGFVNEPLGSFAYAGLSTVASAAALAPADPRVTMALVRYRQGVDREATGDRLTALPGVAAVVDSRAPYDTAQSFMGLFYAFVGVMLVLGGIMAFALIFNTLSANVMERAVELTALRTLGMAPTTVGRLVTAENLLLALVALVPGLVAAYVLAAAFMASFSSDLFQFNLEVRPTTFAGTAAVILLVALLSQWPSLRAVSRLDLASVVRERAT